MPGIGIGIGIGFGRGGGYLSPQQIARELTAPTKQWGLFHLGDSRAVSEYEYLLFSCPELLLTGTMLPMQNLDEAGASNTELALASPDNVTPTLSPLLGGGAPANYLPNNWVETEFLGGAFNAGGNTLQRITSVSATYFAQAKLPLLWSRFLGHATRLRGIYYRHAAAPTTLPGLRLVARGGATYGDPNCHEGPYVYDFSGSGLDVSECEVPSTFPWDTITSFDLNWSAPPGAAGVAGEKIVYNPLIMQRDGPGLIYVNHAVGGCNATRFLNEDIYPAEFFGTFYPLVATDRMLWLSLGSNGPPTLEAQVTAMTSVIARFRAYAPRGPVILDTRYESSTSGSNPVWRQAAYAVQAQTPGSKLFDTLVAMGAYADMFAAGWIVDGVHLVAAGRHVFAERLGDLIAAA